MAMQKRRQRIWWAMGGAFAAAVLAGLACAGLVRLGHGWPMAVLVAALFLVLLLPLAAATPLWRRLDDMAREAHATAWYWGGSAGLGIGLLGLIAVTGTRRPFVQGAMIAASLQVAGYGVCWLAWWAMRRSRAA